MRGVTNAGALRAVARNLFAALALKAKSVVRVSAEFDHRKAETPRWSGQKFPAATSWTVRSQSLTSRRACCTAWRRVGRLTADRGMPLQSALVQRPAVPAPGAGQGQNK